MIVNDRGGNIDLRKTTTKRNIYQCTASQKYKLLIPNPKRTLTTTSAYLTNRSTPTPHKPTPSKSPKRHPLKSCLLLLTFPHKSSNLSALYFFLNAL